jgi:hypothetical protein
MGYQMVSMAYSGQVGGDGSGVMHQMLERMGIDDIWGWTFLLTGVGMLFFSLSEFIAGRRWNSSAIAWFAGWRKCCAGCAAILWLIVGYLLFTTSLSAFKTLTLTVPLHLAMACYFVWENSRVRFYMWHPRVARAR